MKRLLSILLILVVLISAAYNAAADALPQYDAWLINCDFDSILGDLQSGSSGIVGRMMFDLEGAAETCQILMEDCVLETDDFTGEFRITHTALKDFGIKCQVYPFINKSGFYAYVGFPYRNALHYDTIYLNFGSDGIIEYTRSDKEKGFNIQFEMLNGKSWEYSMISGSDVPLGLLSVSFRENGSVSKVDYSLTENEMIAFNALALLAQNMQYIHTTVATFDSQRR